jgi:predicted nucleotidyltransferase
VYGFGSFFRGGEYDDVDILFVVNCRHSSLLRVAREIRTEVRNLSEELDQQIDDLVLTSREFGERPLRDMSELRKLN